MSGVGGMLAEALEDRGLCSVLEAQERPWASATFVGARHRLTLAIGSDAYLDGIEEAEFDLGSHLLADLIVIERRGMTVVIEALTIEDHRPPMLAGTPSASGVEAVSAPAFTGAWLGQIDAGAWTRCGTKRAFVPLAAA